jgi:anti-sigma regulatory factor (Ser/Thr protein kinase)
MKKPIDIRGLILAGLKEKGTIRASDVVRETGFSRVWVHRFLRELVGEGKIELVGKANLARYVAAGALGAAGSNPGERLRLHRILRNAGLREDAVLEGVKREGGVYERISPNTAEIFTYAFTEILNNAIEHSGSGMIDILVMRDVKALSFDISDKGVGIFNNIMKKKGLASVMEAIQDLLKGKETTAPAFHSGEGIFFTSKIADRFVIRSFGKKLTFDNEIGEIFVRDVKRPVLGTKVFFSVGLGGRKRLKDIFDQFTDENLSFSKTTVKVRLYHEGADYVSRSQARRVLVGLERFKTVELDFSKVETIGQGFADEVFRVWHSRHPDIHIIPVNAGENVEFMIRHVTAG